MLADRVALLEDGRITAVGTHSELLATASTTASSSPASRTRTTRGRRGIRPLERDVAAAARPSRRMPPHPPPAPRTHPARGGDPMSVTGVEGEERHDFTQAECRQIRQRSLRLLGRCCARCGRGLADDGARRRLHGRAGRRPGAHRLRHRPGPARAARGRLDAARLRRRRLPAHGRRRARAHRVVHPALRPGQPGHAARPAHAGLPAHAELSLEFHEPYTSGRIISRQTTDLEAIRELLDEGINQLVRGVLYMSFTAISLVLLDWRRRSCCSSRSCRSRCSRGGSRCGRRCCSAGRGWRRRGSSCTSSRP